jgi:hypothetical protein
MADDSRRLRIERGDEQVRQAVMALIVRRRLSIEEVAEDVGIPVSALTRRLISSGSSYAFTASEARALADYFGLEGGELFEYMNGQYLPAPDWRPRRPGPVTAG